MKTIAEIRLANLERLIAELGTQEKVAEACGTSSIYLSQIKNQSADAKTGKLRQMGDEMARKLEVGCGKERGWMDNPAFTFDTSSVAPPSFVSEQIPLLHSSPKYDALTIEAIGIFSKLDEQQKFAMLAKMREYLAYLGPPQVGQALSMAE